MNKKETGSEGENVAVILLQKYGYRIVDMNVRPVPGMSRGEIDIVAWDGPILCFIEVKTRISRSSLPLASINYSKRRQLIRLAEVYVSRNRLDDTTCRFDVITVAPVSSSVQPSCRLYKDAFRPSEAE